MTLKEPKAKHNWEKQLPYLLILPALIFALVYRIYPIFYSFFRAFHFKGELSFQTYINLFQDKNFWNSLWITIKMNLIMIPLQIVISFILALLVNASIKGILGQRLRAICFQLAAKCQITLLQGKN